MANLINMGKNCCSQDPCNPNCNGTYAIDSFTIQANSPVTGGANSAIDSWDGTTVALGTTYSEEGMNTSNRCSESKYLLIDCATTELADRNFTLEGAYYWGNGFQQKDSAVGLRQSWDLYKRVWNVSKDKYFLLEKTNIDFAFSILPGARFSVGVTISWIAEAMMNWCTPYINGQSLDPSLRNTLKNWNQCSFTPCLDGDAPTCTTNPISTFNRPTMNNVCCGAARSSGTCATSPSNFGVSSHFGYAEFPGGQWLPYDSNGSLSGVTIGGWSVSRFYSTGILNYSDCEDICGPLTLNLNSVFAPGLSTRVNGIRYKTLIRPTSGNYFYPQGTDPPDQYRLEYRGKMQFLEPLTTPDYATVDYVNGLSSPDFPSFPYPTFFEWVAGSPPYASVSKFDPTFVPYTGHTTIEVEEPLHAPSIQVTLSQCQPGIVPM